MSVSTLRAKIAILASPVLFLLISAATSYAQTPPKPNHYGKYRYLQENGWEIVVPEWEQVPKEYHSQFGIIPERKATAPKERPPAKAAPKKKTARAKPKRDAKHDGLPAPSPTEAELKRYIEKEIPPYWEVSSVKADADTFDPDHAVYIGTDASPKYKTRFYNAKVRAKEALYTKGRWTVEGGVEKITHVTEAKKQGEEESIAVYSTFERKGGKWSIETVVDPMTMEFVLTGKPLGYFEGNPEILETKVSPDGTASVSADGVSFSVKISTQPEGEEERKASQGCIDFAGRYVDAVNSDDRKRMDALIHPESLACLTDDTRGVYEKAFYKDLDKYDIRSVYTPSCTEIGADATLLGDAFTPGMYRYPVRPNRMISIDFETAPDNSTTIVREAIEADGSWHLVIPCYTAEGLATAKGAAPPAAAPPAPAPAPTAPSPGVAPPQIPPQPAPQELDPTVAKVIIGLSSLLLLISIVGTWKFHTKAGRSGISMFIPVYNIYVMLKIAGRPGWWLLLYLVPLVNIYVQIRISIDIARNFGKGTGFAAGLFLLPFIFYPILGFGDARYRPASGAEDILRDYENKTLPRRATPSAKKQDPRHTLKIAAIIFVILASLAAVSYYIFVYFAGRMLDNMQITIERTTVETAQPARPAEPQKMEPTRMEMIAIQGGCFDMGDTFGDMAKGHDPAHKVCLDDFEMDKYEVTNAQYEAFKPGFDRARAAMWEGRPVSPGDNNPVVDVTWFEAKEYCESQGKRLPTEAEWEYAARSGGKKYKYGWGDNEPSGNIADESALRSFPSWEKIWTGYDDGYDTTAPAGSYQPNELGLNDMTGNVWEWVADWYGADYYARSPETNPRGPDSGEKRVVRGGAWESADTLLRVEKRTSNFPDKHFNTVGFRCAK